MEIGLCRTITWMLEISTINLYCRMIVRAIVPVAKWFYHWTLDYNINDDVIVMNKRCTIIIMPDHQKIASSAPGMCPLPPKVGASGIFTSQLLVSTYF